MTNYEKVKGTLTKWRGYQRIGRSPESDEFDASLDALEAMRKDGERLDTILQCAADVDISVVEPVDWAKIFQMSDPGITVVSPTYCKNCGVVDLKGGDAPLAEQFSDGASVIHKERMCSDCECSQTLPGKIQSCNCRCHPKDREQPGAGAYAFLDGQEARIYHAAFDEANRRAAAPHMLHGTLAGKPIDVPCNVAMTWASDAIEKANQRAEKTEDYLREALEALKPFKG